MELQKYEAHPIPARGPAENFDPGFARPFGVLVGLADRALALLERDLAAAKAAATASLAEAIPELGTLVGHTKTLCQNNGITHFHSIVFPI